MTTSYRWSPVPWKVVPWCLALVLVFSASAFAVNGCLVADVNGDRVADEYDVDLIEANIGRDAPRFDLDGSGMVDDADAALSWSYRRACPTSCLADLDDDGNVGEFDRLIVEAYQGFTCPGDLNRDGQICPRDTGVMNAYLGSPTPLSPSAARADLNGDGVVDKTDADILVGLYDTDCSADLNRDAVVDADDIAYILAAWGPCPPSLQTKGGSKSTCVEEDP